MRFVGFRRGRSAANAIYESDQIEETRLPLQATMFLKDLDNLIIKVGNVYRVEGRWSFCKRGANYGLIYVGEEYEG